MRFCRWYPLADAAAHTPAAENVLQLRVAEGLLDYPNGKSAMVHYAHAQDARAAAIALAAIYAGRGLWCRHLEPENQNDNGDDVDLRAFHARVRDEFTKRFGREPSFP